MRIVLAFQIATKPLGQVIYASSTPFHREVLKNNVSSSTWIQTPASCKKVIDELGNNTYGIFRTEFVARLDGRDVLITKCIGAHIER